MSAREKPLEDCTPEEVFAQLEAQLEVTGGARKHVHRLEEVVTSLQESNPNMTEMEAIETIRKQKDLKYMWKYFRRVVANCVEETGSFGDYRSPITKAFESGESPEGGPESGN